jgi:hypothetical protein
MEPLTEEVRGGAGQGGYGDAHAIAHSMKGLTVIEIRAHPGVLI